MRILPHAQRGACTYVPCRAHCRPATCGADAAENLALACDRCNSYKGTNLTAIDPDTNAIVALFHPRQQPWDEHFEAVGDWIVGFTPAGSATVRLLQMNKAARRAMRSRFIERGEF